MRSASSAITRPERRRRSSGCRCRRRRSLTDATVIRIGQLVGAAQVVVGSLQLRGRRARRPRAQPRARGRSRAGRRDRARPGRRSSSRSSSGSRAGSRRPSTPSTLRRQVAAGRASAGRGLRELHQGAARRNAGDGHQLPERRADARIRRSTARAGVVGRLRRAGRSSARAGGGSAGRRRRRRGRGARASSPGSRSST